MILEVAYSVSKIYFNREFSHRGKKGNEGLEWFTHLISYIDLPL